MSGADITTAGQETTPSAPVSKGMRVMPSISELRKSHLALLAQLESERSTWDPHWKDIAQYMLPYRARFYTSEVNQGGKGKQSKIRDAHATYTLRTLAAGMNSGMTSAARPWFEVASPDDDLNKKPNVRAWCEEVTQRLRNQLLRSNFYQTLPSVYYDVGGFATGAVAMVEDDKDVVRFYSYQVGSYSLAASARGDVNTFARRLRMTPQQLVEQFGEANVSQHCLTAYRAGTRQWIEVLWVVCPNLAYDPKRLQSRFKRFTSAWWEISANEDRKCLRLSGFDRFPILVARWEVAGEDVYGSGSPGMIILPDVKELQEVTRKTSRAIEKMVDPPMLAPSSAVNNRISLMSGDVNVVPQRGDEAGFRALHEMRFDVDHANQKAQDLRRQISRGGFEDLFLMISRDDQDGGGNGQKTAREIAERHEEKLTALGPVLNQVNSDFLSPLIEGLFEHMNRYGMIPPPPEELSGQNLKIEFVSVLAQAQKLVDVAGIERGLGFITSVAQIKPDIVDVPDLDGMVREYFDRLGVASTLVLGEDKVAALRDARAKQQQQQMQAEVMAKQAQAAKNLAGADTTGQNALTDVLGGAVPGQAVA